MGLGEKVVTVFGSSNPPEGSEAYETARAAGRVLAELGYAVANGGYGGTMEASARGAKDAGGSTIGVLCDMWGRSANAYTDQTLHTATLIERLETLIDLGRCGYVALPGATGTLVELAMVWELACKKIMVPPRPIVCLGAFWKPLIAMMNAQRPAGGKFVQMADTPADLPNLLGPKG